MLAPDQEEKRNSQRTKIEIPLTFKVGRRRFSGTTANLSDDGMLIESSFAKENVRKLLRRLLQNEECPVVIDYTARGKSFTRRGMIRHFQLSFSGRQRAYRLSIGVWIPKLRIRQEKGL